MAEGPARGRQDEEHVLVRPVGAPMGRDHEFTTFVLEHRATLLRAAWLLVGNAHRAEDLAQQALERTYVAWPRARTGDPVAYARRVLVNLRTDTWRRRRREVLVEPGEFLEHDRPHHDPDRAGDRDRLVRALATLSERQRRIVVLRYLMDLSEAEVAEDLGVSVGTVKSTASRALAELRAALGTRDGLEGAPR